MPIIVWHFLAACPNSAGLAVATQGSPLPSTFPVHDNRLDLLNIFLLSLLRTCTLDKKLQHFHLMASYVTNQLGHGSTFDTCTGYITQQL